MDMISAIKTPYFLLYCKFRNPIEKIILGQIRCLYIENMCYLIVHYTQRWWHSCYLKHSEYLS